MIVSFIVAPRIRQRIHAMVLRASALLRPVAPSHEAGQRTECSDLSVVTLSVVTRNSTPSNSNAGAFSRPGSAGLALALNEDGLGPISEPRPQRLNAARQHGDVEARVAHDAVTDPGAHARGAHDDEGLVADVGLDPGADLIEAVAQLGVGDVEGVGHVPGRVLAGRAHVQDRHVFGEGVRAGEDELAGQHVVGDQSGLVDGVLGLAVGRGVSEVQIDEVSRAQAGPHGGGDDVDAAIHAVGAHGLCAKNLPVGAHVHEDVHGLCAGEIARVLVGVRVHREVLRARGIEGLAVSAGHCGSEATNPNDCGALGARDGARGDLAMLGVGDRIGDEASPAVRGSGQGDRALVVTTHCAVTDRVDVVHASTPVLVDEDVAALSLDAAGFGEGGVGAHAGRQDDDVGCQHGAVGERHGVVVVAVRDGLGGDACVDAHAEAAQFLRDQRGHLDFERRQDVLGELDEVGLEASMREGLNGFDADEPGAEDDGSRARGLAQGEGVVDRAQGVHARGVEAVDRGPAGKRPGGKDQVVVGERVGLASLRVGDLDAVSARVNCRDLGVDAHVEVEGRFEGVRGVEEELGGVFDLAADVVREPAVREGHVLAALEHDDLGTLVAPAQAGRRAHATRDSSDDNYSHVRLTFYVSNCALQHDKPYREGYRTCIDTRTPQYRNISNATHSARVG